MYANSLQEVTDLDALGAILTLKASESTTRPGGAAIMALQDYYSILGVEEAADQDALKRVYRTLARLHHPDCNPGDEKAAERFKRIQEAYTVLSNPERRRTYDAERRYASSGDVEIAGGDGMPEGVGDFFEEWLKERQQPTHTQRHVTLSFEQALRGGHIQVKDASGAPRRVTIPRGCRDGLTVRLRGPAEASSHGNGHAGDLYVTFRVKPDRRFRREGNHLHVLERISAVEAMLGTTRSITNAYGRTIRVPIPAGTQPGERLRLRGQGVATSREAGDLFVEIEMEVPRELSEEQRAHLRQAAESLGLL